MDFEIYNMLVENHLISPTLANSKFSGAIISKDRTISVMFNEEDHLREQCTFDTVQYPAFAPTDGCLIGYLIHKSSCAAALAVTISVMFNEEDHLREQCILDGLRLDEAYAKLLQVDEAMYYPISCFRSNRRLLDWISDT